MNSWQIWFHSLVGDSDGAVTLEQMLVRAVLIFFVGLALIRATTPRIFSKATPLDIVLSVIIGSNLSRALTGNAPLVEVIAATALLVMIHAAIRWLATYSRTVANVVKGKPMKLVEDGVVSDKAMEKAAVGRRDLEAALRSAGATDISEVKLATMERGGDIDVVLK